MKQAQKYVDLAKDKQMGQDVFGIFFELTLIYQYLLRPIITFFKCKILLMYMMLNSVK